MANVWNDGTDATMMAMTTTSMGGRWVGWRWNVIATGLGAELACHWYVSGTWWGQGWTACGAHELGRRDTIMFDMKVCY